MGRSFRLVEHAIVDERVSPTVELLTFKPSRISPYFPSIEIAFIAESRTNPSYSLENTWRTVVRRSLVEITRFREPSFWLPAGKDFSDRDLSEACDKIGVLSAFSFFPHCPTRSAGALNSMKALLLTEYKKLEVSDVEEPEVGPQDVLIQVEACGICGSDIHGYDGSTGRRIPPLVMGHEAAGIVVATGSEVTDLPEGTRVTFDSMVSCGNCEFCRKGKANLCDNRMVLGVSCGEYRRHGAFAERISVPRRIVYELPETLPFEHAALVEAVSVAVHAANVTPTALGDTAVIVGAGMIGLLTLQAARAAGASQIIAVDINDRRLEVAKSLGADATIRGDQEDVAKAVQDLTRGKGADIAYEVVGATPTIKTAIESVRKGGSVTLVGNVSPTIELPLQSVVTREVTLRGTCGCNGEYPECIDLMNRGIINVAPLITAKIALSDGPAWFDRLYSGDPEQMKVVVQPQQA